MRPWQRIGCAVLGLIPLAGILVMLDVIDVPRGAMRYFLGAYLLLVLCCLTWEIGRGLLERLTGRDDRP